MIFPLFLFSLSLYRSLCIIVVFSVVFVYFSNSVCFSFTLSLCLIRFAFLPFLFLDASFFSVAFLLFFQRKMENKFNSNIYDVTLKSAYLCTVLYVYHCVWTLFDVKKTYRLKIAIDWFSKQLNFCWALFTLYRRRRPSSSSSPSSSSTSSSCLSLLLLLLFLLRLFCLSFTRLPFFITHDITLH